MFAWFKKGKRDSVGEGITWNVRSALQDLKGGRRPASQVFPELAERQISWYVAAHPSGPSSSLSLQAGSDKVAVVFTDRQAAATFAGSTPVREVAGYELFRRLQREGFGGLLVNPKDESVSFDRTHMRLLFREYALVHARSCPVWSPSRQGSILALELSLPGVLAVPVYLEESDAVWAAEKYGGVAVTVTWGQVRTRLREVSSEVALLQHGTPEEVPVTRDQVAALCNDGVVVDPLQSLEMALLASEPGRRSNSVLEALARCDRIWVITDLDGDIVALGEVFDTFTSATEALALLQHLRLDGQAKPFLLPANALFDLMPRSLPLAVNRGSSSGWTGDEASVAHLLSIVDGIGTGRKG